MLAIGSPAAYAGVVNLLVENDVFTGTDRHYTSGVMLNYVSEVDRGPERLRKMGVRLPGLDITDELQVSLSLGHEIYTPTDIDSIVLLENDRPYAGYLYIAAGFTAKNEKALETWRINLGVVGPAAKAEWAQNALHRLIDVEEAEGWDNQLRNEWTLSASYEKKWLNLARYKEWNNTLAFDVLPQVNATIGTPQTDLGLGVTFRFGQGLNHDQGPPRIRPSLATSQFYSPNGKPSWYAFVSVEARWVAYNVFLDGNSFVDSHSVDRKNFVSDLQTGLVWNHDKFRVAYTYVVRSKEFDGQDERDIFGSLSLSFRF